MGHGWSGWCAGAYAEERSTATILRREATAHGGCDRKDSEQRWSLASRSAGRCQLPESGDIWICFFRICNRVGNSSWITRSKPIPSRHRAWMDWIDPSYLCGRATRRHSTRGRGTRRIFADSQLRLWCGLFLVGGLRIGELGSVPTLSPNSLGRKGSRYERL